MDIVKNTLSFKELVTIRQIQKLDTFVLTFSYGFLIDCFHRRLHHHMTRSLKVLFFVQPRKFILENTVNLYCRYFISFELTPTKPIGCTSLFPFLHTWFIHLTFLWFSQ